FEKFKIIYNNYKNILSNYKISKNIHFFFFAICLQDAVALNCEYIIDELEKKFGWAKEDFEVLKNTTLFYGKITYKGSEESELDFGVDDFKKYI
ncbi:MAG: hypothetical protein J7K47_06785, partial [Thermoplasmata archaeon]|nr:hypothetical protein [Thermoplasmata archaeon]